MRLFVHIFVFVVSRAPLEGWGGPAAAVAVACWGVLTRAPLGEGRPRAASCCSVLSSLGLFPLFCAGFDSLFDFNLRSYTDLFLNSDRGDANNIRLANNWRPVWENMFKEFPKTDFVLHHKHNAIKVNISDNVKIVTYDKMAKPPE